MAATNPCKCGFYGDRGGFCQCTPPQIQQYRSRISGPLLDRIDLQVKVPRLKFRELMERAEGESSAAIRARVLRARQIQARRFRREPIAVNAEMPTRLLRKFCPLEGAGKDLLEGAVSRLGLSVRAVDRIRKVARTISDLRESPAVEPADLAEAIQYRSLDRPLF